jgi:hypothetical protein
MTMTIRSVGTLAVATLAGLTTAMAADLMGS